MGIRTQAACCSGVLLSPHLCLQSRLHLCCVSFYICVSIWGWICGVCSWWLLNAPALFIWMPDTWKYFICVCWMIIDNRKSFRCDVKRIWHYSVCSSDSLWRKILTSKDFSCYTTQAAVTEQMCVRLCPEVSHTCIYRHFHCTFGGCKDRISSSQ